MFGFAFIMKIVGWFSGVNISGLINGITDVIKNRQNAEVADHASDNSSGVALGTAYLRSVDATNNIKLESKRIEGKWGLTLITTIIFFTIPIGIHFAAIVFDSMTFWHHRIGDWDVGRLPVPYDALEISIIQSLYYIGGGVGAVSMLAKAFGKR
jgi:hypothetical protein